ncbi:MAG: hypothetical protein ACTSUV_02070 [Candidatus Ranarchaeia archaeon]
MLKPKRILKVIEGLTSGELDFIDLEKTIDQIYRFSHLVGSCKNSHNTWKEEFLKVENYLIMLGIINKPIDDI